MAMQTGVAASKVLILVGAGSLSLSHPVISQLERLVSLYGGIALVLLFLLIDLQIELVNVYESSELILLIEFKLSFDFFVLYLLVPKYSNHQIHFISALFAIQ